MVERVVERPRIGVGALEIVAEFFGPMPTGVAVANNGRMFVCFPRWDDRVDFTVGEVVDGQVRAFPDAAINRPNASDPATSLISVQSVVADARNRLWMLDTGSIHYGPTSFGGPKLIGVDLARDRVVSTILFPPEVALPTTYLNDVRFDLRRGTAGMAFITDSSPQGPNGLIVVDLDSGQSWRRLHDHPTTKPVTGFLPIVEGEPLMTRSPGQPPQNLRAGSDGIAITPNGEWLFYCPLASRRLYSVSVSALADRTLSDGQVAQTVANHGEKGVSDGMVCDAQNRIYMTNYEHNSILRRLPNGLFETVVQDPRLLWPDALSIGTDRNLYITANQLHRQPSYHWGEDLRRKPYYLFRTPIGAGPAMLG